MSPPKIQLSLTGSRLPPCESSPQLMPFHIAYSGPAPISTFFRVKEMKEKEELPMASSSSSSGLSGASGMQDAICANGANESGLPVADGIAKTGFGKKLVAAFRGRRIVGVEVPLPEGYAGLVLRSETSSAMMSDAVDSRSRRSLPNGAVSNGRRKTSTRGFRRSKPIEINDSDETPPNGNGMDIDGNLVDPSLTLEDEGEVKTLKATQTFQSIVVWNPDVVVDEGRDEYIRALREWTAIASEVHRMED